MHNDVTLCILNNLTSISCINTCLDNAKIKIFAEIVIYVFFSTILLDAEGHIAKSGENQETSF